jgi:hypothetical protein
MIRRRQKMPSAAASELSLPDPGIDRLERKLKSRVRALAVHFGSEAEARQALLGFTANPRDRAVYKALLKKDGPGRPRDLSTKIAGTQLLTLYRVWQSCRAKPGSDLEFARFYHRRETKKKIAAENEIRAIAKRLQRARKRVGQ